MNTHDLKRRSVRGVVSYGLRTSVLYGISIVATGLLGVYLSPADFGIYFIVTSVIGIFTFMSDVGLAATLIQKKDDPTIEELRTTFTVQQVLAFLIFFLSILLTPVWKTNSGLSMSGLFLLYSLAFSFVLASFKTIPSILLERKLAFDKLVIPQIAENILFYGIAVVLARRGFGVNSFTIAVFARSLIGVAIIYYLQRWPIGFSFSKKTFRGLLSFGAKFQLNDFLARIKDDLFIVVLARFLSDTDMGYLGWAKRWSMFPYQLSVNSVVAVTFPTFSRLQNDKKLLAKAIEKSIFFISLLIFPILAGMSALAYPLTILIPHYEKWQPAIASLVFFCINIGWSAASTPLTNTLNAIGEISKTLKLMIFWTAATWLVTPVCVYLFGFTGVAIASALIGSTSFITILMIKRVISFRFIDQVWRQLGASIIMYAVLRFLQPSLAESYGVFILGIIGGGLIYIVLMWLSGYTKVKQEVVSLLAK